MNGFEIPLMGMATGIIIPVAVFVWLYFEQKLKKDAMLEIAKHIDDPKHLEELLTIFDERKKEPIDYRRGGLITFFVGSGIFGLGYLSLGSLFEGVGVLVGAIGAGTLLAGYLYPKTSEEITNAVEEFERE